MSTSDFWDIFGVIALIFSFCLVPLLITGVALYVWNTNLTLRKAHQNIAQALGFQALNQAENIQNTWYGGTHHGRRIAFTTFASIDQYNDGNRSRRSVTINMRIVMEATPTEINGLNVQRKNISIFKDIPKTFEDMFTGSTDMIREKGIRDAMLAFTYLDSPIRKLTLVERSKSTDRTLREEILPGANAFLIHERPASGFSPEQFNAVINELSAVAQAIDTGITPALLTGKTTPPKRKNTPWIIFGIMFVIVPICTCLCAVAYTMLTS